MKKISLLLCIVLVFSMLVSCSVSVKDSINSKSFEADKSPVLSSMEKIYGVSGKSFSSVKGNLVSFVDDDECTIYNIAENKIVATMTNVVSTELFSCYGKAFALIGISVDEETEMVKLLNEAGEVVATLEGETVATTSVAFDLFTFDSTVYRVDKKGKVTAVSKESPVARDRLPSLNHATSKYYYNVSGDSVSVYDRNLKLINYWELGYSVDDINISVMANGSIIVQTVEQVASDSRKFTYTEDDEKYLLSSFSIHPKTGRIKNLALDHIIDVEFTSGKLTSDTTPYYGKGVANAGYVTFIKNGRLYSNHDGSTLYSLDNKGKIKGELFGNLRFAEPESVEMLSNNRYLFTNQAGEYVLADGKGRELMVTNSLSSLKYNYIGIVKDGVLYDFDLNKVYDATAKNFEQTVAVMNRSFIFLDTDGGYHLCAGENDLIYLGESAPIIKGNYFTVAKDDGKYSVYNELGTKLRTLDSDTSSVCSSNGVSIVSVYDPTSSEIEYYRLSDKTPLPLD